MTGIDGDADMTAASRPHRPEVIHRMEPILKWPGGKTNELPYILPNVPPDTRWFYEPFVGGGSVFLGADDYEHFYVNDKSQELFSLYSEIRDDTTALTDAMDSLSFTWSAFHDISCENSSIIAEAYHDRDDMGSLAAMYRPAVEHVTWLPSSDVMSDITKSLSSKATRMRKLESTRGALTDHDVVSNVEGAVHAGMYTRVRDVHNHLDRYALTPAQTSAAYLFIRTYCYSSMFRYNSHGEFNVPYGGVSYNTVSLSDKSRYYRSDDLVSRLAKTTIGGKDFLDFMQGHPMGTDDFMFCDPPYDTDFSSYSGNDFADSDQGRLARYLIGECLGRWMVVIKSTELIKSLYPIGTKTANGGDVAVSTFGKHYLVSFKNRNRKDCTHMLITNYSLPHPL